MTDREPDERTDVGTRNLTTVTLDGELRIAQYGQWDGYLAGVGAELGAFFGVHDLEDVKAAVRDKTYFVDVEQRRQLVNEVLGLSPDDERQWITMEESEKLKNELPSLHRDNSGPHLLLMLMSAMAPLPLYNDNSFREDGVFCEYVYDFDLDAETVTITMPGFPPHEEGLYDGKEATVVTYPLADFPRAVTTATEEENEPGFFAGHALTP